MHIFVNLSMFQFCSLSLMCSAMNGVVQFSQQIRSKCYLLLSTSIVNTGMLKLKLKSSQWCNFATACKILTKDWVQNFANAENEVLFVESKTITFVCVLPILFPLFLNWNFTRKQLLSPFYMSFLFHLNIFV